MGRLSHHSKSKVGRRRSQLALSKPSLAVCPQCKGPTLPHRACPQCGVYVRVEKKKSTKPTEKKEKTEEKIEAKEKVEKVEKNESEVSEVKTTKDEA